MNLLNSTRNQHFLSRAEQILNAANPSASDKEQRIFSFSIRDRENYEVTIDSLKGRAITNTLVLQDLFSFDVVGKKTDRLNFEDLFLQYEKVVKVSSISLLDKLQSNALDVKTEVLSIFVAKLMNLLRNPYSVRKVLNTMPGVCAYYPTDPVLRDLYNQIINGRKPHQRYLCSLLQITHEQYQAWLSTLFMLLVPLGPGEPNLLESIVIGLCEDASNEVIVFVNQYLDDHSSKACLLSDRSYVIPIPEADHLSFSFNLRSNAFITYCFIDMQKIAPGGIRQNILDAYMARKKVIKVSYCKNDLDALAIYNRHAVYQCFKHVFCSSTVIHGLQ